MFRNGANDEDLSYGIIGVSFQRLGYRHDSLSGKVRREKNQGNDNYSGYFDRLHG